MKTAIIGGGIAGLSTAIALKNLGLEVEVFEAAPEVRPAGAGISLAGNAMQALRRLGIAEAVMAAGRVLPAFQICSEDGRSLTRLDAETVGRRYGVSNFAIHRERLHEILLQKLDQPVHTGHAAVDLRQGDAGVQVLFRDGSSALFDYLVVADGIHSAIRHQLLSQTRERYAGYTCWRAVIPFTGIETPTETWGQNGRVGLVPLADGQLYWFACVNAPARSERMKNFKVADLQKQFGHYHDPIPAVLAATRDENLLWNDISDLEPLPRYAFNRVVLVGDAGHATTPNMGQGACQALEDAVVLADEWARAEDPILAFQRFEQRRLPRTHYVINQSRIIGRVGQLQNRLLVGLRNTLLRLVPAEVNERQLARLLEVDF